MDHTSPSSPATLPSLASRRPGHPRPLPPPTTTPQSPTTSSPTGSIKRRRSEFEGDDDDIKLHIANKKACDQCKQHKQKCDRDENEQKCRRCIKNNRGCSFTDGFKRTAKRDEHAARESEVVDLRAEIAELRGALVEKNSKIHELQATCDYLRRNGSINANNIGSGLISQTSFGTTPTMPPMTSRVTSSTPANYPIGLSSPSLTSPTNSHAFPYTPSSLPSSGPYANIDPAAFANPPSTTVPFRDNLTAPTYDTGIASHEADASHSLLRLSQRGHTDASSNHRRDQIAMKSIGDVRLPPSEVAELFSRYWSDFHPYLPLLDDEKQPDDYFKECQMLYWVILFVASRRDEENSEMMKNLKQPVMQLVYTTLSQNSQSYNIVKGLCLICTWPPYTSSTSTDPTFDLAGIMMAMAMRLGLHRPSHTRDFARSNLVVPPAEVEDRLRTWAACNVVAQSVSTGYGQPSLARFDYILKPEDSSNEETYPLPSEFRVRLAMEILVKRISTFLYRVPTSDDNSHQENNRHNLVRIFDAELRRLLVDYSDAMTDFDLVYFKAANLHLHLSAFFAPPTAEDYILNLRDLYNAASNFIDQAGTVPLSDAPNYIMQMLLAAGFTILRLLNGFFAHYMDTKRARSALAICVRSVRDISVASNDLPCRLAEVLAQMSKASPVIKRFSFSLSSPSAHSADATRLDLDPGIPAAVDDSLKLLVKYRRSMSIVYDSVWSWREMFQGKGASGNLDEAVRRPTDPESGVHTPVPLMGAPQQQGEEMDLFSGFEGFEDFGAFDQTFDPLVGLPDVV